MNKDLKNGDPEEYKNSKHILNFISPNEIKKLNFLDICKYADYNGWSSNLACHGGGCLFEFRHALFILIKKNIFIKKFKENPNFVPNIDQTSLESSFNQISLDDAIALQNLLLNLNMRKFLKEIRFPSSLLFLGVLMNVIGEKLERQNRKSTIFLCTEFRNLYPRETESIKNR